MAILKNYFLNSSLHGLHFIANNKFHWTERLFWTACVLASWGASLALMLSAIQEYQAQKISFSVDTVYLDWKTNFPSIVICEGDNKKTREESDKFFGVMGKPIPMFESFVFFDGTLTYGQYCEVDSELRHKCLLGNYSDYMHKLRSACSEIVGLCRYNNEEFSCCEEFLNIRTYSGPCFAFNSLVSGKYATASKLPFKIVRDTTYGYGNLSIELFHSKVTVYGLSPDAVPTKTNGLKFKLLSEFKTGYLYNVFLSVKETFTDEAARLMNAENRGCRFYDENNLRHSNIYSMSTCENDCIANAQKEICGCIAHTVPHFDKNEDCDFDGLFCLTKRDNVDRVTNITKSCDCMSSCFDAEVNKIGSTSTDMKNTPFANEKSVVRMNFIVYPPTIRYSRSVVKTPLSMLCSVGGTVGLFIGASLLTIIEIIYYFIVRPLGDKYVASKKKNEKKTYKRKNYKSLDYYENSACFEFVN